jgi:protein-S-isoprenylcysteine O-methyltransferase Ste14
MLLLLLGWGLILSHALAFLLATAFVPIMNRMQIGPEERILTDRFGSEFVDYQTAVRRWL